MSGFLREFKEKERGKSFHNRSNKELEISMRPNLQGSQNLTVASISLGVKLRVLIMTSSALHIIAYSFSL